MPQLDLDHLVRIGANGHGENNCGMATAPSLPASIDDGGNVSASARDDDGDAPAESVLLRARDGAGLAELFCAALRRDRSTKGSSNPKAEAATTRKQQGAAPRSGSRRLTASSSKTAAVIGVLPKVVAKERRGAPGRVAVRRRRLTGVRVLQRRRLLPASLPWSLLPTSSTATRASSPASSPSSATAASSRPASLAAAHSGVVTCFGAWEYSAAADGTPEGVGAGVLAGKSGAALAFPRSETAMHSWISVDAAVE
ncbi:hypothetical protein BAE44_0000119 [Dichanthelium oligosanthes]|uniref:Uncharacterized protein n=1 Tax=Dichanthelium oligosanthes TaxID=888268 RepID=A0A1E5WNB3_9POAL|nr:hypothetical protein BAE44_0000119 [Dichanthelium oligosanthes]